LGDIGIPSYLVVKVRRRSDAKPEDRVSTASSSQIIDIDYLKKSLQSWGKPPKEDFTSLDIDKSSYFDIVNPDLQHPICAGDIVFLACAQDVLVKVAASFSFQKNGLRILNSSAFDLGGFGSEIVEAVLASHNPLVGKTLGDAIPELKSRFGMGVLAFRSRDISSLSSESVDSTTSSVQNRKGDLELQPPNNGIRLVASNLTQNQFDALKNKETPENKSLDSGEVVLSQEKVLRAGDLILAIVEEKQVEILSKDQASFYVVSKVGNVPKPITLFGLVPVAMFAVLLCVVASDNITMCPAALLMACVLLLGGWVTGPEIVQCVDLRLLILIATSISFAKSISTSGLAADIAALLNGTNATPIEALFMIYAICLILTEIVSNNAAAALMYPIAVAYADELKVDYKPFALIVMFSASMAFACPIGYQTHMMVWQPGGYRFIDFVIYGLPIDVIYMIGACLLTPAIWKF